ncbi:MAG: rod-binding protein [Solirubrobacterales bacterium]
MDAQALTSQVETAAAQPRQRPLPKVKSPEQAKAVAKQFEAVFVTQMMSHMFAGVEGEDGMFGGGHAEAMFRPMLLDEYGKMVSNHGRGIGIADKVARSLLQTQEVQ